MLQCWFVNDLPSFSVVCKTAYQWVAKNCCFVSNIS